MNQFQGTTVVVVKLLQNPGFDLTTAVGEGDAVEVVLDDSFSFRRGLLVARGGGDGRLHRGIGRRRSISVGLLILSLRRLLWGRLWPILLKQRLESNNDQEGEREYQ